MASSNVQRGLKRLPPNLREVMDHVAVGVEQVHEGTLMPGQLSAMAAGATALVKLVEAAVLAPGIEALRLQDAALSRRRSRVRILYALPQIVLTIMVGAFVLPMPTHRLELVRSW